MQNISPAAMSVVRVYKDSFVNKDSVPKFRAPFLNLL